MRRQALLLRSSPKCEPPPIVNEAPARPKTHALCINGSTKVLMHVAIEAKYTGKRAEASWKDGTTTLWQLSCEKKTGECSGVSLNLDSATKEGIAFNDLTPMQSARLTTVQGQMATITWGAYRTFTVDFATQKVRYAESAADLEGRGEADCPPN